MREKSETLIRLSLKITFLSNIVKHFPWFIPFHQAAKLFPPPLHPHVSETTHILPQIKIHPPTIYADPSIQTFSNSPFPFKPKGDSRPLRRSTPEFSCVCPLLHLIIIPLILVHSAENAWAHPAKRESSCRVRVYPAADPFPRGCGMRRCVRDLWRQTPATLLPHRSLPAKRNPLRLAVSRDLPVITRNPEEERKEDRDRNNDDLLETFRFEWPKGFVRTFVEEGILVSKCLALIVRGVGMVWRLKGVSSLWGRMVARDAFLQVISAIALPVIVWR